MNMTTQLRTAGLPQNDSDLLQRAFDALLIVARPGASGEYGEAPTQVAGHGGERADAVIEIVAEGKRHRYVAELKQVDRFATLGMVKHQLDRYDQHGVRSGVAGLSLPQTLPSAAASPPPISRHGRECLSPRAGFARLREGATRAQRRHPGSSHEATRRHGNSAARDVCLAV